jgi:multiple sugar transport system permease protein
MSTTTAAAPVRPDAPEPQAGPTHTTDPRRRKRTLMAIGGALVALVFVAPYLVMVLD